MIKIGSYKIESVKGLVRVEGHHRRGHAVLCAFPRERFRDFKSASVDRKMDGGAGIIDREPNDAG
jgi:hypothetical protein